jgi:glyoxylase-like metal-dependent hydrolase (beta-lactamase superfamily II)/ferredoxin
MAHPDRRLPGNVEGNFFVDDTCIDCDLCRQIAPATFTSLDGGCSVVYRQPVGEQDYRKAASALVTCPTGSIGARRKIDLGAVRDAYPEPICENVHFCGYASRDSFGGSSYLIVRPEGNVLVDSPRFARTLVGRLEKMGGVRTMFLTHRDDVADHEKFRRHFGCDRIIHGDEAGGIRVERYLGGEDPVAIADDLGAIPTPGHTRGHTVLLYRDRYLFSGDHLAWSSRHGHLIAFRRHNWYSWPETIRSMERLADYTFEWVLPGHGRRAFFPAEEMPGRLLECVRWMKAAL